MSKSVREFAWTKEDSFRLYELMRDYEFLYPTPKTNKRKQKYRLNKREYLYKTARKRSVTAYYEELYRKTGDEKFLKLAHVRGTKRA